MKTFIFDYDRGFFVNTAGGVIAVTPTLVYGEQAEWRFLMKTATGAVYPLSGLVELTAAVGFGGQTLAATYAGIAVDTTAGSITVPIDCLTQEFYAATAGKPNGVYGFFELSGYDNVQQKVLYFRFNVLLSEIALPDVYSIPGLPERIIAVVSSGGFIDSGAAAQIASGAATAAAQSATSGAIFSGAEVVTQLGDYRLTFTSGGGLAVSGSGASVVLSGGQIAARIASAGESGSNAQISVTSGGIMLHAGDDGNDASVQLTTDGEVYIAATGADRRVYVNGDTDDSFRFNSRPVATQLVTSTDSEMQPVVSVLSGGTSYVFDSDRLYSLEVASVVKTTEASYIHFTLDSVTAPTPVVISGVSYLNSATFEGGKEYLVGFFDGMAVVNEVTQ